MGQVKIYLDSELEIKMRAFVKAMHLSQNKWIADLIEEKIRTQWPESVIKLAGAWKDFPTVEEIRQTQGTDAKREEI
ncbi:MAG: CopG family transcriptional regulator [Candidatus Omnitrophota bacterium]